MHGAVSGEAEHDGGGAHARRRAGGAVEPGAGGEQHEVRREEEERHRVARRHARVALLPPAGRDSLMSRLRILEKIALITAPVMHSTDAASRRQTSTPNAVPETSTRVDASVSSAFLADMDIGAARSGERAT